MTLTTLKKAGLATLAALAITSTLPAASAMAAGNTASATPVFQVQKTTDARIRSGVRAFKQGKFETAVSLHRAALKTPMSARKAAIAHSNLCAAYGKLGEMENAQAACSAALELRPDYAAAVENKSALTLKLAQK